MQFAPNFQLILTAEFSPHARSVRSTFVNVCYWNRNKPQRQLVYRVFFWLADYVYVMPPQLPDVLYQSTLKETLYGAHGVICILECGNFLRFLITTSATGADLVKYKNTKCKSAKYRVQKYKRTKIQNMAPLSAFLQPFCHQGRLRIKPCLSPLLLQLAYICMDIWMFAWLLIVECQLLAVVQDCARCR